MLVPLHLGAVHAIEWALSLALIVGPLAALGVTIVVVRRRDAGAEQEEEEAPETGLATGR
jgi:hypothetical protein